MVCTEYGHGFNLQFSGPIETIGMTIEDLPILKSNIFNVTTEELE